MYQIAICIIHDILRSVNELVTCNNVFSFCFELCVTKDRISNSRMYVSVESPQSFVLRNLASILLGWLFWFGGWLGGAVVLGKLPVPGRPSNLADSRTRAAGAGGDCLDIFILIHLSFLPSFSLSLGDGPIQTEILS